MRLTTSYPKYRFCLSPVSIFFQNPLQHIRSYILELSLKRFLFKSACEFGSNPHVQKCARDDGRWNRNDGSCFGTIDKRFFNIRVDRRWRSSDAFEELATFDHCNYLFTTCFRLMVTVDLAPQVSGKISRNSRSISSSLASVFQLWLERERLPSSQSKRFMHW